MLLKMQMQAHHYKRHRGVKKQQTSHAILNEVYSQHHGVFSTGAPMSSGPPLMHNMLSSQAERAPPFLGSQLEAIKRRAYEQQNADIRDEVGEDDGEAQSLEDDEESDARDEDSKSEGGDESGGEDEDREG